MFDKPDKNTFEIPDSGRTFGESEPTGSPKKRKFNRRTLLGLVGGTAAAATVGWFALKDYNSTSKQQEEADAPSRFLPSQQASAHRELKRLSFYGHIRSKHTFAELYKNAKEKEELVPHRGTIDSVIEKNGVVSSAILSIAGQDDKVVLQLGAGSYEVAKSPGRRDKPLTGLFDPRAIPLTTANCQPGDDISVVCWKKDGADGSHVPVRAFGNYSQDYFMNSTELLRNFDLTETDFFRRALSTVTGSEEMYDLKQVNQALRTERIRVLEGIKYSSFKEARRIISDRLGAELGVLKWFFSNNPIAGKEIDNAARKHLVGYYDELVFEADKGADGLAVSPQQQSLRVFSPGAYGGDLRFMPSEFRVRVAEPKGSNNAFEEGDVVYGELNKIVESSKDKGEISKRFFDYFKERPFSVVYVHPETVTKGNVETTAIVFMDLGWQNFSREFYLYKTASDKADNKFKYSLKARDCLESCANPIRTDLGKSYVANLKGNFRFILLRRALWN